MAHLTKTSVSFLLKFIFSVIKSMGSLRSFIKRQMSDTSSDNEWQQMTASDSEWQQVVILANFPFFWIREEPTTMHPKKHSLNIEEDLEERLLK